MYKKTLICIEIKQKLNTFLQKLRYDPIWKTFKLFSLVIPGSLPNS